MWFESWRIVSAFFREHLDDFSRDCSGKGLKRRPPDLPALWIAKSPQIYALSENIAEEAGLRPWLLEAGSRRTDFVMLRFPGECGFRFMIWVVVRP